jgi:CheY-like chemotaxis protein
MVWVLVVDDDEATCEALRQLLGDAGYAIAEAPDGQAALEMLRSTPYHAIVLFDLLMPVLDGRGLLAAVAADPSLKTRHAYILMTANHQAVRDIPPAQLAELAAVVYKPFAVDALLHLIRQAAANLAPDE